jgi:hypothetical protein
VLATAVVATVADPKAFRSGRPMLYVTFQQLRERVKARFGGSGKAPDPPASLPATSA